MSEDSSLVAEPSSQFDKRKEDHIRLALEARSQSRAFLSFELIQLQHNALPDLNFDQVDCSTQILTNEFATPFFVSSMTAGHKEAEGINARLAEAASHCHWPMSVGSQRKELFSEEAKREWLPIREKYPDLTLIGNIGISQAIVSKPQDIQALIDSLGARAIFIHLNALQEVLQVEGTPYFQGGLDCIKTLCSTLSVPVLLKETGCGFSLETLKKLNALGIHAVDLSGSGGTHWGRIEGFRSADDSKYARAAKVFADWGISTPEALLNAKEANCKYEIWASGGVRNGLDAAKCIAMGAKAVGFAKVLLQAATQSTEKVIREMKELEFQFKIALFCTGAKDPKELREKEIWKKI